MWRIEADDHPHTDLLTLFDSTHKWIAEAISRGGKVLVHCHAGVSRSASVVIAYIMKELHLDYKTARMLAQRARGMISPNEGFEKQLQYYGALGCVIKGESAAHSSLQGFILNDGRMDAIAFMDKWTELEIHV